MVAKLSTEGAVVTGTGRLDYMLPLERLLLCTTQCRALAFRVLHWQGLEFEWCHTMWRAPSAQYKSVSLRRIQLLQHKKGDCSMCLQSGKKSSLDQKEIWFKQHKNTSHRLKFWCYMIPEMFIYGHQKANKFCSKTEPFFFILTIKPQNKTPKYLSCSWRLEHHKSLYYRLTAAE